MKKSLVILSVLFAAAVFIMMSCAKSNPSTPAGPTATNTAVPTSTAVASPNVVGTITIPASSSTKQYKIIIDNDADYTNGTTVVGGIKTGTCGAGTAIQFAMQVAPGTYYICAFVDKDNSGMSTYDAGDYRGYYPSTVPPGAANLTVPGSGSVTADFPITEETADLTISLVLPGVQAGKDYFAILVNAFTYEAMESPLFVASGTCPASASFDAVISGVSEGDYYLVGLVNVDNSPGGPPTETDYLAVSGGSVATLSVPASPNIHVNNDMNITLSLETCNANVSGTLYMPEVATGHDYVIYASTVPLNGITEPVVMKSGTVSSSTAEQAYSFFIPIKMNYYLTGVVDVDDSGLTGPPGPGDYAGIYGVPTPITTWTPFPFPASPNVTVPSSGRNIYLSEMPSYGTISGNLQLPTGEAQPGVVYEVLVDTNMNFSDGIVNMALSTCGGTVTVPYSVTAAAGTYYVYAVVKTSSGLQYPPEQGDYVGVYGAGWPATPGAANVTVVENTNSTGKNISMFLAANNVSGTLTLPAGQDGKNYLIMLDDDGNGGNGGVSYLRVETIPASTGTSLVYGALCLFPGAYHITAQVDVNASGLPGNAAGGDYVQASGPFTMDPTASNGPYNMTLITIP